MNVYDFDGTLYHGDSTVDFYKFCLTSHPVLVREMPGQLWAAIRYAAHRIDKTQMKERFYRFFRLLPSTELAVTQFWETIGFARFKTYYVALHQDDDVVVSASPEFLLKPACKRLKIGNLIASRVDPRSGVYDGLNCHGAEKVLRFEAAFPGQSIHCFYSDSLSDAPLASLADRAFLVKGEQLSPWPH